MAKQASDRFYPTSREAWRTWLKENHQTREYVWLVCYKKGSAKPTISWSDAVDEALCFGWVDSVRKSVDKEQFIQFFSKRKPRSTWSRINKEKVQLLMEQGLMTRAGLACIETAKQNGSWTILDEVEDLKIPKDLAQAFKLHPGSKAYFTGLSKSVQKMMLQWLVLAKRPETRQKRIDEIATRAAQGLRPGPFT